MKRQAGVLLPLFSLPCPYGIGGLGEGAYRFVDFLRSAGQSVWQILPIGPTGMGDSPYQSFSAFGGNSYFIDLDALARDGLITHEELSALPPASLENRVDYPWQAGRRMALLRRAYERSERLEDAGDSLGEWVSDYALFMALKDAHGGAPWWTWEETIRRREASALCRAREKLSEAIGFHLFLQKTFFLQWDALRCYANQQGVEILGDIPIYTALDSADVWANPRLFQLDGDLRPIAVAGCPPDGFSPAGQLWGNPLYQWDAHEQEGYAWWIARFAHCRRLYDRLRIDHFRGFDGYYAIPYGEKTAACGHWEKGKGRELFNKVKKELPDLKVVAEDLGFITRSVEQLLEECGFPGMRVLQFAFDSRDEGESSIHLPHLYKQECVAYTGTHDNETLRGWLWSLPEEDYEAVQRYLDTQSTPRGNICQSLMALLHQSSAQLTVVPLADYLQLGNEARINTPSTTSGNWLWRVEQAQLTPRLAEEIRALTHGLGRELVKTEDSFA